MEFLLVFEVHLEEEKEEWAVHWMEELQGQEFVSCTVLAWFEDPLEEKREEKDETSAKGKGKRRNRVTEFSSQLFHSLLQAGHL